MGTPGSSARPERRGAPRRRSSKQKGARPWSKPGILLVGRDDADRKSDHHAHQEQGHHHKRRRNAAGGVRSNTGGATGRDLRARAIGKGGPTKRDNESGATQRTAGPRQGAEMRLAKRGRARRRSGGAHGGRVRAAAGAARGRPAQGERGEEPDGGAQGGERRQSRRRRRAAGRRRGAAGGRRKAQQAGRTRRSGARSEGAGR